MAKYKDFNINFTSHPNTGDISMVSDEKAISQSMKNLILTDEYEIPFLPRQAGNIRALLFDLLDPLTAYDVKLRIKTVLENYEPRIDLLDVKVKKDDDNNGLFVDIVFRAKISTQNITVQFYLDRVV